MFDPSRSNARRHRPSPPKGPLTVDNVTKESCSLAWSPPEDDGSSEITNYVVERREIHSNSWVPVSTFVTGTSTTAPKLHEGHEYEFRVFAENASGRSDPLAMEGTVIAKDPWGTPGRPDILDHDVDRIELAWTAPRDNGGSTITHYEVERKDQKTGCWIKVNMSPVMGTHYVDERVQPGHAYEYRVRAVNKFGQGQPSDPSETAWARPKHLAPQFELGIDGEEIRVRCGDSIDLTIPYIGAPRPEIKWTRDGVELDGIQTDDFTTRLYVSKSRRSDSGQCRIVATNASGRAEARVLISVMDRPGPPEGPITYPSIMRRSVIVAWKPPKDDGGAEINGYHIEYREVGGSMEWEKVPESTTLLWRVVRNLKHRKQYRFRVFAENLVGRSEPLNGEPVTAKDPFDPPDAPGTPEVTGYDTNMVALKWTAPRDDGSATVTHFMIERYEKKGGGDWALFLNMGPVHGTSANVTGLAEGETYQFRICAVNAAGQGPPSRPCKPVTCRRFVAPPDAPDRPRIMRVTKTTVGLSWMRPAFDGGAPVEGYVVEYRKVDDSSDWTRANTKPVRDAQFTVEGLTEKERYEFRIIAVNKAGESDPSKPSDVVFTENQPGRPILDLSGLRDIVVRAGETITFTIPYTSGGLRPTVDAFNGTSLIYEDDRTVVDVDSERIVFITKDSRRADGGPYKLVIQNRCGRDFAKLHVTVLDVPGKPTEPILFSELSGEAVTLHWSPPKDDGGSPVSNYVVERKVAGTENWERVGQPVGTNLRVRELDNGTRYDFRVRAENEFGVGAPLDTGRSILAKTAYVAPKINLGTLTDVSDTDHATLENRSYSSHISIAASRRDDSGSYGITVHNEHGIDSVKCTTRNNIYIDDVFAQVFSYLRRAYLQIQLREVNRQFNRILSTHLRSTPRHVLDNVQIARSMNGFNRVSICVPINSTVEPIVRFPNEIPNFVFAQSGNFMIMPTFHPHEDYNRMQIGFGSLFLRFCFQGDIHNVLRRVWTQNLSISIDPQIDRTVALNVLDSTCIRALTSVTVTETTDLSLITKWASVPDTKHVKVECATLESAKKCLTLLAQGGDELNLHARLSISHAVDEEIDELRKWAKITHGVETPTMSKTFDFICLPEGVECTPPCFN